jgi:hypothetical protein
MHSADFPRGKEGFLYGSFNLSGRTHGLPGGNANLPDERESFLLSKKGFYVLKKACSVRETVGVESKKGVLRLVKGCDAVPTVGSPG